MYKLSLCLFFTFLFSCQFERSKKKYLVTIPAALGDSLSQNPENILTKNGVKLGKKLFYDPILSKSNTISCASCHNQKFSFADKGKKYSLGESKNELHRNTPPLINLAWAKGYFWDGGAKNLESQVFAPITHKDEMAQDLKHLANELRSSSDYPILFKKAFGDTAINSQRIAFALAQFERTLISANSKYDQIMNENFNISFTQKELQGKLLFQKNCNQCHTTGHFTDYSYHLNGVDTIFNDNRFEGIFLGRYRITKDSTDIGKYKTPTLRNIALTAPYFHDGRFEDLDTLLKVHYSKELKFSISERQSLIAFLQTLTDEEFIASQQFSKSK